MLESIGFIGTGSITEAVVDGLAVASHPPKRIILSPRNHTVAARLARDHGFVEVAQHNQHVVDQADTVILALRPQAAEAIVRELRFRAGQQVISVMGAISLEQLRSWLNVELPITLAIPLHFAAEGSSVTAIYPASDMASELFNLVGTSVECESQREYDLMAVATALMATYYGFLNTSIQWLNDEGMSEARARSFMTSLFANLTKHAIHHDDQSLSELTRTLATPGGLNEQVLKDFEAQGGACAIQTALDRVQARITGQKNQ